MTGRARTFGAFRQRVRPRANRLVGAGTGEGRRPAQSPSHSAPPVFQRFRTMESRSHRRMRIGERGWRVDGVAGGCWPPKSTCTHTSVRSRGPRHRSVGLEKFGDAEVEQLDAAIHADEQFGRLDVAMDDQVGVRVETASRTSRNRRTRASMPKACASQ